MTRVKDPKDQIGMHIAARPILYCPNCGAEQSANAGDYWDRSPDHTFTCCNEPMRLVCKSVVYEVYNG